MSPKVRKSTRNHSNTLARMDPGAREQEVLKHWTEEDTFAASLRRRADRRRYTFYDGPPYATGSPHYGHILQTTIKDAVTRYWTMRGYRVDRRVGWDCHGLPVENLVEKELGIKAKQEIEALGIEKFNAACRASVFRTVDEWKAVLQRMGRWADYANAYATLDPTYMESVWWVFQQVWDAGLVTSGFRSSPYCPRCATPLSNFETALGYKPTDDPAVVVKLQVTDRPSTYLLIWTTTPWTLPGNVAVAVHPDLRYVQVGVADEHWILAKDRVAEVVEADTKCEEEYAGMQLAGLTYEPLYTFLEPEKPAYRVVAAPFVSATEGTGIVHIAPAFGEEDLKTAEAEDLPILETVDREGRFVAAVTPWAGQFVKDADAAIIADLSDRGVLVRSDRVRHEYPYCWRCDTSLIYYATHSWFITVSRIREQLKKNNERIHWVPEHLKEGRFGQGLSDAPDWAVSRSRYWGTPMPVWVCPDCGEQTVVGSVAELQERGADVRALYPEGPEKPLDLHRPYVDRVTFPCRKCRGESRRIPDVFDVWMDSGSMPYAQWHYPFENRERVEGAFPADFIGEALDQTRGWFYTLHVLATILTDPKNDLPLKKDQPAFLNAIVTGLVLAEDGKKLSKRLKNYPEVLDVVQKYGADTLRLYLLSSARLGEDYRISDRLIEEFYRKFTLPLTNVVSFYDTYAQAAERTPGKDAPAPDRRVLLDRWMLARTAALANTTRERMEAYRPDDASRALVAFIDDLSNWYVRRSRKRFSAAAAADDRAAAFATLEEVLSLVALASAPLIPFFSEFIFRKLHGRSPHLEDTPEVLPVDEELLKTMQRARNVVSLGLQARAQAGMKVRQPLQELVIGGRGGVPIGTQEWRQIIADEVNVKAVTSGVREERGDGYAWAVGPAGLEVGVRTELTSELKAEGIVRDLIRHVQELRKDTGLTVEDTIELSVRSEAPDASQAIASYAEQVTTETRARALMEELTESDGEVHVTLGGAPAVIRIRRVS